MKNERFRNMIDGEMAHVRWAGSEEVMKQIQGKRPLQAKRPVFVLVAAMLTLCMATALAVGLLFAPRYDAERAAKKAIQKQYGISDQAMGIFYISVEENDKGWQAKLKPFVLDAEKVGEYTASVSKDGKVTDIQWSHDGEKVDGNLPLKDMQAWDAAALDKAVAARVTAQEKEYREMFKDGVGASQAETTPEVTQTKEEKNALERAKQAMLAYGLSEETLSLFKPEAVKRESGWQVMYSVDWDYVPGDITGAIVSEEPFETVDTFGVYTVTLGADKDADTVAWDREGAETGTFTKENLGKAKAYDKKLLPIVKEFVEAWHAIADKYPEDERDTMFMSLEDAAALGELYRKAGFTGERCRSALPKKGNLSREEALEIVRKTLKSEAGMTDEMLDASKVFVWYLLPGRGTAPDRDVWRFSFHLYGGKDIMDRFPFAQQGIFTVVLYADNGEVFNVAVDPMFAGNG